MSLTDAEVEQLRRDAIKTAYSVAEIIFEDREEVKQKLMTAEAKLTIALQALEQIVKESGHEHDPDVLDGCGKIARNALNQVSRHLLIDDPEAEYRRVMKREIGAGDAASAALARDALNEPWEK